MNYIARMQSGHACPCRQPVRSIGARVFGLGDPLSDASAQASASSLVTALQAGCAAFTSANPSVTAFQQDFNAAGGSPTLAVDGLYGPATQAALASILGSAPVACVVAAGTSSGGTSSLATTTASQSLSTEQMVLIGAGVMLVGGAIWYRAQQHKGKR